MAATSSRSPVQAPVDRYFHPPSARTTTIVPRSISPATLAAPGQGGAARDAREDAHVGQPPRPLDRLTGTHDALAVEQLGAAPLLVDRRDVALVEVAQPLDPLAERRLDGHDLDLGVLFLEEPPDAHQRAGRAESGDEVGDLGAVAPDLGTGALVVGPGVGLVGVLVEEGPLGVLVGQRPGPGDRPVRPLLPRGDDDLGAPHLEGLAPLDRHVLGHDDLDRVARGCGRSSTGRCRCCPRRAR